MIKTKLPFLIAAAAVSVGGCAGVKLSAEGEKVRVLTSDEVSTCKKLGRANASVTSKVLGIDRKIGALQKELTMIARNSASNMGGDTIVPVTAIEDGTQSFTVYKCVDPQGMG